MYTFIYNQTFIADFKLLFFLVEQIKVIRINFD